MGLAPYGDPAPYRDFFRQLYALDAEGAFKLFLMRVPLLHDILAPRQDAEPFTQAHKDLAAAAGDAGDDRVPHAVALPGGDGRVELVPVGRGGAQLLDERPNPRLGPLRPGVRAARGARCRRRAGRGAVPSHNDRRGRRQPHAPLRRRDLGPDDAVGRALESGARSSRSSAAPILRPGRPAAGRRSVIGWVQGRSEFGPRALGNRSILADPRPAENKTRINAMIKKREALSSVCAVRAGRTRARLFRAPDGVTSFPS